MCFPTELEGLLFCVASLLHLVEEDTAVVLRDVCRLVTTGANQDNAAHRLRMYVFLVVLLCFIVLFIYDDVICVGDFWWVWLPTTPIH